MSVRINGGPADLGITFHPIISPRDSAGSASTYKRSYSGLGAYATYTVYYLYNAQGSTSFDYSGSQSVWAASPEAAADEVKRSVEAKGYTNVRITGTGTRDSDSFTNRSKPPWAIIAIAGVAGVGLWWFMRKK
jgi:hypothetical protein